MKPDLIILKGNFMISQIKMTAGFPEWIDRNEFFSFTKTDEEISVVCKQKAVEHPDLLNPALNRKIIKVNGHFDLSVTGIIAGISGVLAGNGIPIFTISTFNTDYILIRGEELDNAVAVLRENGYKTIFE